MVDGKDVKERLREEVREYLQVAGYLFVCFCAILWYGSVSAAGHGGGLAELGFAAGKALILGKFVLIGEAAGTGSWLHSRTLGRYILHKTALLVVLLLLLSVAEEFLVGWWRGQSVGEIWQELARHRLVGILADSLLLMLVIFPYVGAKELIRALGSENVHRVLRGPPGAGPKA
jgi:hypothetical protein